jgi:DNA-binding response OmpR family regulator
MNLNLSEVEMVAPRILIVDDEANIRFVLERTLTNQGYILETANNGAEAIEYINKQHYDLILLDLQMEPVNGIQVLRSLRETNAGTVVIILTAHGTIDSAVDALRLGAFDYVFKPAMPETIRQRVQEGLAHRQQLIRRQLLMSQMETLRQTLNDLEKGSGTLSDSEQVSRFIRSGKLVIDRHHRVASLDNSLLDLTTTEFNLLTCLAEAAPKPVAPRQLVRFALGYDVEDSEAGEIAKGHIHHLRQKIETDPSKPRFIKTVRFKGYLWSG